jgi:hypothetical protein
MTVEIDLLAEPRQVSLAFEKAPFKWEYLPGAKGGKLRATLEQVTIHAAIVVEQA